jgi:hypothetical protein
LVAREEDCEALGAARWVGFAQDFDDFWVGKPFRDMGSAPEAASQFYGKRKSVLGPLDRHGFNI